MSLVSDVALDDDDWGHLLVKGEGKESGCLEYVVTGFTWDRDWTPLIREARLDGKEIRMIAPEDVRDGLLEKHPGLEGRVLWYDVRKGSSSKGGAPVPWTT